jgi:hypothetical protein
MFCKYWLGLPPTVEYRTGDVIDVPNKGLCSRDKKNGEHRADGLCYQFEKSLKYL